MNKKILFLKTSISSKTAYGSVANAAFEKILLNVNKKEIIVKDLNDDRALSYDVLHANNINNYYDDSDKYIDEIKNVKLIVIATSMINFAYPATLKNWLDKVIVAKKSFYYTNAGKDIPMIKDVKVIVINAMGASGRKYRAVNPIKLLKHALKFIGIKMTYSINIHSVKLPHLIDKKPNEIIKKYSRKLHKICNFINKI